MDVALMTEGTYPYSSGGVSVWCDQLVRGMPAHTFQVVALVAGEPGSPAWELPPNISAVHTVTLWGGAPARRRFGRRAGRAFAPIARSLFSQLCETPGRGDAVAFGRTLRALYDFAQRHDLGSALGSEAAARALAGQWAAARRQDPTLPPASLHDVVTVLMLLEHALRPFSARPVLAHVSHCVANGLGVLPALTARWTYGTPILLTEHGIYLRESYLAQQAGPLRWPVRRLYLAFLRKLCEVAYLSAAVVAPGNAYNARWEQRLGTKERRIRTVYNGVDPADFPQQRDEPEVPTISWAGRIDPIKDLETLIRSFALVTRDIPDARLRLFGGAPAAGEAYRESCRALAQDLGVGGAVTFEGRVPEIRDAYAAGHVVVLSSISEGFPYTVIEAMTSGRACVATDVGGVAEALGDTGLLVPARDPERMAAACRRLLQDQALRTVMGTDARNRALELFTVDRATSAFDEMYTLLAAGRPLMSAHRPVPQRPAPRVMHADAAAGEAPAVLRPVRQQVG